MSLEVAELSDYVRERTIDWLLGMQTSGFFDGFTESDEETEDEVELVNERNRILSRMDYIQ